MSQRNIIIILTVGAVFAMIFFSVILLNTTSGRRPQPKKDGVLPEFKSAFSGLQDEEYKASKEPEESNVPYIPYSPGIDDLNSLKYDYEEISAMLPERYFATQSLADRAKFENTMKDSLESIKLAGLKRKKKMEKIHAE